MTLDDLLGDFDFDARAIDFDYSTKEGWREFVDFVAARPLSITEVGYDALSSSDRAFYNIARERYMTIGARVSTPSLRQVAVAIRHALTDNRSPDASKSGVIISGRPGMGKTTAVHEFGRAFERMRRARSADQRSLIPVAYVPVPTHATAKTMIMKLADFYALPHSRNVSYEVLLNRVGHVMRQCATELVIVDDIHRLDLHYRGNEQVADAHRRCRRLGPHPRRTRRLDVPDCSAPTRHSHCGGGAARTFARLHRQSGESSTSRSAAGDRAAD